LSVVVTGAAGFIGMHVVERLLDRGEEVVGVDNLTPYYDPTLKKARVDRLTSRQRFTFHSNDIADASAFQAIVRNAGAERIVHLAAQAGVRYSLEKPFAYEQFQRGGAPFSPGGGTTGSKNASCLCVIEFCLR
jgi:UDP-glucuronate 4-epimerase